ncbi:MAG: acyl carrier protein [Myxococcota bacterium]
MAQHVEEKVRSIVADQLGKAVDEIEPEAKFVDDLGMDSLDVVETVMALEKEFKIQIPDEEAQGISTVREAISYVEAHRTPAQQA